ncbi:M4 family metallopeptidase [Bacillus sp. SCS-151]|uniref:M4 family metallopeptidase n=1 Tax=Nanhaiella sioensis TaxID=3115293 RepID=UPI00397DA5A4
MKKNRKIVSSALATGLAISTLLVPATGSASVEVKSEKVSKEQKEKTKQQKKLDKLREKTTKQNGKFKVSWDEKKGVPRHVSGKLSDKSANISSFLEENKDVFNIEAGEFNINDVATDELGMTHYRTQLTVDGIPVYGAELLVHTDANGVVTAMNGQVEPKLENKKWSKSVKLSQKDAIQVAEASLSFTPDANTYTTEPASDLYVYKHENKWMPVYIVELQFLEPYIGREFVFIDAKKGDVLRSFNQIQHAETTGTGTGVLGDTKTLNTYEQNGTYYLSDRTKPMTGNIETYDAGDQWATGTLVSDSDNNFNSSRQKAAVDAHYYAGVVYDYFKNEHNRNSYDNRGSDVVSSVHVRDPDALNRPWNNAAWVGTQMVYGDGDGTTFTALSGSLDVVAHELTHAVTDFSADLVYEFEPGALNESFSDVFGIIVEAGYEGSVDWLLGEEVYTPHISGDALRSISNPTLYNQPAHYDDFVVLPNTQQGDWGGVHINSGIPNKAFYNIATTIGLDKSGDIYYRALTQYLTSQSQFIDARNALLQSAADLFGEDGTEYNAVADGFSAVGIGGGGPITNDTFEPNDSLSEAHSITSGDTYTSYISSSNDEDFYTFTTGGAGDITVDLTNVPKDYDLYLLNASGSTVAQSENARTSNESITFSASGADTFYVKVIGYNGANSTSPYSLTASFPGETTTEGEWFYENASYDTPHPYSNNFTDTFTYQKAGAQQVAIHFSAFETEARYDFVHITDGSGATVASYDGAQDAFWVVVDGDEINATLDTDFSITAYGYTIDQVGYFSDTPLVQGFDQEATEAFYDEIEEADKPDPEAYVAPEREEKEEVSEGEESGNEEGSEEEDNGGN